MSKSTPNKDLIGKGLRTLLQNMDAEFKNPAGKVQPAAIEKAIAINRIALTNIIVNPKNPRKDFDEKALQELAQSLKMHDLIQPITVAQLTNGKFQLIAGERRFRAAKIAGLKMIEAFNKQYNHNFISIMPTNIYGINDNFHLNNSHVIPALIEKIYTGFKENKKKY